MRILQTPLLFLRTPLLSILCLTLPAIAACRSTSLAPTGGGAGDTARPELTAATNVGTDPGHAGRGTPLTPREGNALASFAAGCFWGVEDTFRHVPGVVATAVGYAGGHTDGPTYESVCTHTTGHAETVLVEFDPKRVSYETLVNVFFKNHDPTTMNRQGPDVGDQYRSAIFTLSAAEATLARGALAREQTAHDRPVVTIVEPLGRFWKAEDYHQQYDERTGRHSCPIRH
jgi:peptide-methionine (S)-S-oxide reductase